MSSTSTTNSSNNQSFSGSTTPNAPSFLTQPYQDLLSSLQSMQSTQPYQTVAPTPDLTTAFNSAQNFEPSNNFNAGASLIGDGSAGYTPSTMSAAQVAPAAQASATTAAPYIQQYLNPATQDVANTTMQQLNQANQMALNDVNQGAELAGGYGGSRQGVAQAVTNNLFTGQAANALSNLNLQNFSTALGAAQGDASNAEQASLFNAGQQNTANLAQASLTQGANAANQGAANTAGQYNSGALLSGGGLLGNIGTAAGNQTIANNSLLGSLGTTQYGIAQNQANDPYLNAGVYSSLLNSVPSNLFLGQNVTSTGTSTGNSTQSSSNPMGMIGTLASLAAAIPTGGASLAALPSFLNASNVTPSPTMSGVSGLMTDPSSYLSAMGYLG